MLEVTDTRIWDDGSPPAVLAALKRTNDVMTGHDKRHGREYCMKSSMKKRRQGSGYFNGEGHKVKKKVRFDLEA